MVLVAASGRAVLVMAKIHSILSPHRSPHSWIYRAAQRGRWTKLGNSVPKNRVCSKGQFNRVAQTHSAKSASQVVVAPAGMCLGRGATRGWKANHLLCCAHGHFPAVRARGTSLPSGKCPCHPRCLHGHGDTSHCWASRQWHTVCLIRYTGSTTPNSPNSVAQGGEA